MTRWSPRRARRHDIHPDATPEILQLTQLAEKYAPKLLGGEDPDRVGLVLIRPKALADYLPTEHGGVARVVPREELEQLARSMNLAARHRPGWFGVLFLGPTRKAFGYLAPEARKRFEETAS